MEKLIEIEHSGTIKVPASAIVDALLERFGIKAGAPSRPVNLPPPNTKIGDVWPGQGGVYAGMMKGVNGVADYPLILANAPSAYFQDVPWGPRGVEVPGAVCEYDGAKNTQALLAAGGSYPAAEKVAALTIDGHHDFYLWSRREAALVYANLGDL